MNLVLGNQDCFVLGNSFGLSHRFRLMLLFQSKILTNDTTKYIEIEQPFLQYNL